MARIVPKLNLNKTPNLVDDYSLVFAKNIKLLTDGTIGRDDGISKANFNFANVKSKINEDINKLTLEIDTYTTNLANLQQDLTEITDDGIILDYLKDKTNNGTDFSAITLPASNNLGDSDLFEYYDIIDGSGSEQDDPMGNYNDDAIETTDGIKTLVESDTLRIPVFSDDIYDFIKTHNVEYRDERILDLINFCYDKWKVAVNKIKTENSVAYSTYFTEVPDTRSNDNDYGEWQFEYHAIIYYFNWFLSNHGKYIAEQINAIANSNITSDIQYQIQYYRNKLATAIKKKAGLQAIYTILDSNNSTSYDIVGVIPYNTAYFVFIHNYDTDKSFICRYDEDLDDVDLCNVKWHWSGGTITGNASVNLKGQTILNIAEYKDDSIYIPFKSINLDTADYNLDESVYTQTPTLPMTNLYLKSYYTKQIPNGTYQFFVRYQIAEDLYTNWIPATNLVYAGNSFTKSTVGGTIRYVDEDIDSNRSFVFTVEHLDSTLLSNYKAFQLGFILNHDDKVVARTWKHFSNDTEEVYFDYEKEFIKEVDISEFLNINYGVFNVKNVTSFKNKLYISNYVETNFNPNFTQFANAVRIGIGTVSRNSISTDAHTYSYTDNGNEVVKHIDCVIDDYSGIYYIYSILNFSGNNNLDISDISRTLFNNQDIKTLLADGNTVGTTRTASYLGFTLTVKVTYQSTGDYSWGNSFSKYTGRIGSSNFTANNLDDAISYSDGLLYACVSNGVVVGDSNTTYDSSEISLRTDTQYCVFSAQITFDKTKVHIAYNPGANLTTLLPGQGYKFFIHYVKKTGEITNGYPINNGQDVTDGAIIEIPFVTPNNAPSGTPDYASAIKNHHIIYPYFTNIEYPSGYDYCFISIAKVKGYTAELFKIGTKRFIRTADSWAIDRSYNVAHCTELDSKIINILADIPCTFINSDNQVITSIGNNYYPSYDAGISAFMGGTGCLSINVGNISSIKAGFVTLDDTQNEDDLSLIKCTPIIHGNTSYYEFYRCNLLGFICDVTKPVTNKTNANDYYDNYYVSGNDIYQKLWKRGQNSDVVPELYDVSDSSYLENNNNMCSFTVYSNYNLNYLALNIDLKNIFKTHRSSVSTKYILCVIQSLEVSDLFKLPNMYKDITQKRYITYKSNAINKFDNTVRSSNVLGDEISNNLYVFSATDYYNIPTTKGKIINMIAIGNVILIHTEDSMFRFSGNNTLSAGGGEEVSMQESDVFDTGVMEVFGSEFGYAGLQDKLEAVTLPDAYVFYDADAKEIYAYAGQGQLTRISDPINKLLKFRDIRSVRLAGDYFNNRIFIFITFNNDIKVTLSYNFKVKSFISLHDFTFERAFNTKTRCYFINNNKIYYINEKVVGYNDLERLDDLTNLRYNADRFYPSYVINNKNAAIVDVIVKSNIEVVKTLNAVNWVASKVDTFGYKSDTYYQDVEESMKHHDGYVPSVSPRRRAQRVIPMSEEIAVFLGSFLMAEESQDKTYCGDKMRIYTDLCCTSLLDISSRANDASISATGSYTRPRFNQGYWTFNYFRDVKNIDDIYNYIRACYDDIASAIKATDKNAIIERAEERAYPQQRTSANNGRDGRYSDNHSLVEGRYFVIRFIFDIYKNFKLENVSLNYDNKL